LEIEEKGRGLALFGWAGVTVFAFLAAFASWQFAPGRAMHVARVDNALAGDITGGIRPSPRTATSHVPTVPTPLPDGGISKDDVDQLRSDLKDLRRVVGRIDMSEDVLARRIANLEDSVGPAHDAAHKSLQPLTPIAPPQPVASNPPAQATPQAPVPAANPPTVSPPAAALVLPPATPAPPPQPAPRPAMVMPTKPLQPEPSAEKSAYDHQAVDRATLEHMLMERAQSGFDGNGSESNSLIPPLPDPVSIVPKSRPPLTMPPQPLPSQPQVQAPLQTQAQTQGPTQIPSKIQPMPPQPDPQTTGSVPAKPVLPIDPTKAVTVKPSVAAVQMSPDEQKSASEKMAVAMREEPPAPSPGSAAVAKPAEIYGFDLGSYKSIGQVKKVWSDLDMRQGKLTKVLTPLAKLGETSDGVEIRLIAGPFGDKEQALRTCHQLRGATAKCEAIAYAGESILTKPAAETEHKPAAELVRGPQAPEKPQIKEPVKHPPLKLEPTKPLDLATPAP
jgi:hypothetical protein